MSSTCCVCGTNIHLEKSINDRCLKCEGKTIIANMDKIYRSLSGTDFISDRR